MLLQALSLPSSIWALLTLCSMRWLSGKESACQCRRRKRRGFDPWVRKIPWSKGWQPTPVLLPGQSHGQRSLAGHSLWGHKESDMTERLHFFTFLSVNAQPLGPPWRKGSGQESTGQGEAAASMEAESLLRYRQEHEVPPWKMLSKIPVKCNSVLFLLPQFPQEYTVTQSHLSRPIQDTAVRFAYCSLVASYHRCKACEQFPWNKNGIWVIKSFSFPLCSV